MGGRRRFASLFLGFTALLILGEGALNLASFSQAPLDFDVGPSTGAYLPGFTESEERLPVTFRWTRERASILVPLEGASEGATLQLRYARFLVGNASVRLFLNGEPIASFSARPGRFRTHEIPVSFSSEGPLRLEILVDDPNPEKLGLAVDWIRIEGARFRLPFEAMAPRIFLAGVFLLTVVLGFSLPTVAAIGCAVALGQAVWFASDPFGMAHAEAQIAVAGLVSTALLAVGFRRSVPLLFLLGYMLKGAALFHPSYFYPDVRLHRRHLEAFAAASGGILERGVAAQKVAETAYPRIIAGRKYAFPYSPVFYLPFTLVDRDARGIEAAMKHVGLVFAALELPLVFLLARALVGAEVAIWAALLTVFLPPVTNRLLYAQWPTMTGHFFDLLAIFFAARMAQATSVVRPMLLYGASGLASGVLYLSSLINLSLFSVFLAWFERKRIPALLLFWGLVATAAVLLVYLPFTVLFFTEILPALAGGEGGGTENRPVGFAVALLRVTYFYGIGFPAIAIAGFLLVRREREKWVWKILAAYGLSFLGLLLLRAVSGMFKDLKEFVYVGPLVAITTGVALDFLWRRGRWGRLAAVMVALGLIGFGLSKYLEYFRMHTGLAGLRFD
jgi:hypothetical protein